MNAPAGGKRVIRHDVISLIGYRGCGKTVVGRRLADQLRWSYVDTDTAVEQRSGRTISEIFETDGQRAFRILEAEVLEEALDNVRCVVSAGGGVVLARRNRRALRSAGVCVWLTAPAEELHRRIEADLNSETTRPRLTERPGLEEVELLLQSRMPVYEATADHVISTVGRSVEEVVEAVLNALEDTH